ARFAQLLQPSCRVIWHDHYGRYATVARSVLAYRVITRGVDGILAVNEPLAKWAIEQLEVPNNRVWYLPNFVELEHDCNIFQSELPGKKGLRIVCVAQFRPEKDHLTLL